MQIGPNPADTSSVRLVIGTNFALPATRENDTFIHYSEQLRKTYPKLINIGWREKDGAFSLEEDPNEALDPCRFLTVEPRTITCGYENPPETEAAINWNRKIAGTLPEMLSLTALGINYVEALFSFGLNHHGNADEYVAKALFSDSPWQAFLQRDEVRAYDFQPNCSMFLDEDMLYHCRFGISTPASETKKMLKGEFSTGPIGMRLSVRRSWRDRPNQNIEAVYNDLASRAIDLCNNIFIPHFMEPIKNQILAG